MTWIPKTVEVEEDQWPRAKAAAANAKLTIKEWLRAAIEAAIAKRKGR